MPIRNVFGLIGKLLMSIATNGEARNGQMPGPKPEARSPTPDFQLPAFDLELLTPNSPITACGSLTPG